MDLVAVLRDGLDPVGFAALLRSADLSQADLARMGGYSRGTVNTWCSAGRKDSGRAPRNAIVLVLLFSMLAPDQRARMRADLRAATHG